MPEDNYISSHDSVRTIHHLVSCCPSLCNSDCDVNVCRALFTLTKTLFSIALKRWYSPYEFIKFCKIIMSGVRKFPLFLYGKNCLTFSPLLPGSHFYSNSIFQAGATDRPLFLYLEDIIYSFVCTDRLYKNDFLLIELTEDYFDLVIGGIRYSVH